MIKVALVALAPLFVATSALGQANGVDLNGPWKCLINCNSGTRGNITQNGWNVNFVANGGLGAHGWLDYPGRNWIGALNMGAVYSPDECRIQFDNGTVWVRPWRCG
jgi:hypothetical protein